MAVREQRTWEWGTNLRQLFYVLSTRSRENQSTNMCDCDSDLQVFRFFDARLVGRLPGVLAAFLPCILGANDFQTKKGESYS